MSKRNEAIGTVECPCKGCMERCDVFRFRERGESEKSVANRRFAGKLYARCSKHGQFGGASGDPEMQEYILCNAKMNAPGAAGDRQPAPATITPATPAQTPKKAAPAPATRVRTIPATPPPPGFSPATADEPASATSWGFFR